MGPERVEEPRLVDEEGQHGLRELGVRKCSPLAALVAEYSMSAFEDEDL